MKLLILVGFLGLVAAKPAAESGYLPVFKSYHEEIGIPFIDRMRAAEEATDFDGNRIIGGNPAGAGVAPHLVGLVIPLADGRTSGCGASMLSNTRSVTAAHCWRSGNVQALSFTLVFGSAALLSGGTRISTTNVQMHGSYNQNTLANDIAMIVHNWVGYNNNINRILLPSGNSNYVGTWGHASGFGRTNDWGGNSNGPIKHEVWLQVIANNVCAQSYSGVIASTICTSGAGNVGTCGGDSGGPLAIGSGNNRQLIGITSFGHVLCTIGAPSAYARVTSFVSWINARM